VEILETTCLKIVLLSGKGIENIIVIKTIQLIFHLLGESSLDLPNGLKHLLCELGGARTGARTRSMITKLYGSILPPTSLISEEKV
jgi:hypothetical protein